MGVAVAGSGLRAARASVVSAASTPEDLSAPGDLDGPDTSAAHRPPLSKRPVPPSLHRVDELSRAVYTAALDGDWGATAPLLSSLEGEIALVKLDVPGRPITRGQLAAAVARLAPAVSSRDQLATMTRANLVTLVVHDLSTSFDTATPSALSRLDYQTRAMQIAVAGADMAEIQAIAAQIQQTWRAARPVVEADDAGSARPTASHFEKTVRLLHRAQSSDDFAGLADRSRRDVEGMIAAFRR